MIRELCGQCAEKLKVAYNVKPIPANSKKITCQECGRRRYGIKYEITKKERSE